MHNDIKDFAFPVMLPLKDMIDGYNLGNPSNVERFHYELVDFNWLFVKDDHGFYLVVVAAIPSTFSRFH